MANNPKFSNAAVNAEAAKLKAKGTYPIVALGHLGATGGTLTNPAGPLIDFADSLPARILHEIEDLDAVDVKTLPTLPTRPPLIQSPPVWSRKLRICAVMLPNRVPVPKMIASAALS